MKEDTLSTARPLLARLLRAAPFAAALILASSSEAQTTRLKAVPGYIPAATASMTPTGTLSSNQVLKLVVGLPLHNQGVLSNVLHQIYDPTSVRFHHYLTPGQFRQLFAPTVEDYQAVSNFATASGLAVTRAHDSRLIMDVQGRAAAIERVFHVNLRTYRDPVALRQFYAPDVDPTVDATLPLLDITGLTDYPVARPLCRVVSESLPVGSGSGPGGSLLGSDFRNAYIPGVSLTGSGQVVGLLEFVSFTNADIRAYEALAGLPNVPLTPVSIDNFNTNWPDDPSATNKPPLPFATNLEGEVCLDIEMVVAMAPGLSNITVFEAPNVGGVQTWMDVLDAMASSNQIRQFSSSWSLSQSYSLMDQEFQQMAMQGQSFFVASGDDGAYTSTDQGSPMFSPYLTAVGGTTLTMSGRGSSWASEIAWNEIAFAGTGGGISGYYTLPFWQQGLSNAANQGSTTMRMTPDVAMNANNAWVIYWDGKSNAFGGTSAAAPLWAAFTALVNQQAASSNYPPAGFVNTALHDLGIGSNYSSCMHDISSGNNTNAASPNAFFAVQGYDLCTGWGSPSGSNLITYLSVPQTARGLFPLYTFTNGTDGAEPSGQLVSDTANTLFGTAAEGGQYGYGTVFSVDTYAGFKTLYAFTNGTDGARPDSGVVFNAASDELYGATAGTSGSYGSLFSQYAYGTGLRTIYDFTNGPDGYEPLAGLAAGSSGEAIFGAAESGGQYGYGTLFSASELGGKYTILHQFTNGKDGAHPQSSLLVSGSTLYGVANGGGDNGYGAIFSVGTGGTGFASLYSFEDGTDGANPLAFSGSPSSKLYGTAQYGGSHSHGTLYSINSNGSGFTVLHSFGSPSGDGYNPSAVMLYGETLYGTTYNGGQYGHGTIFSASTNGANYVVLHNFTGGNDGANPGSIMLMNDGMLYGTANGGASGHGVIFGFAP